MPSAAERLLPFKEFRKLLPEVHRSTIERWITKGVSVSGQIVRLAAVKVGGRWYCSEKAIQDFTNPALSCKTSWDQQNTRVFQDVLQQTQPLPDLQKLGI